MTEATKLSPKCTQKAKVVELSDLDDNGSFVTYLSDQLRRLPTETRASAMIEIMAIVNRIVRVDGAVH